MSVVPRPRRCLRRPRAPARKAARRLLRAGGSVRARSTSYGDLHGVGDDDPSGAETMPRAVARAACAPGVVRIRFPVRTIEPTFVSQSEENQKNKNHNNGDPTAFLFIGSSAVRPASPQLGGRSR